MKGTVKRIMYEKNFGFISIEGEEKDTFFHQVEFDLEDTDRGPQATNIVKV
jgi:cold shock CspA family protein